MKRVEVTVPAGDAALLRELAVRLKAGGKPAREARDGVRRLLRADAAASGRALVAFFRASPLVGADLRLERDKSPGRPIDL
jgi:hypothetical protein